MNTYGLKQNDLGQWTCPVAACRMPALPVPAAHNCPYPQSKPGSPQFPPLHRQAWNLATSLAAFVSDGCKLVDADEYNRRLQICDECDRREGNRCLDCGCSLKLKAKGRAFRCPLGRWAPTP